MPDPKLTPDPLTTRYARALLDLPRGSTALEVLSVVTDLRTRLALFEVQAVAAARREGRTWDEIGALVGMSRQNAYRKYGAADPRRDSER